jgi:hypothetical protein
MQYQRTSPQFCAAERIGRRAGNNESETAAATEKRRGDSVAGDCAGGDCARKGGGAARPAEEQLGWRRAASGREAAQSAGGRERGGQSGRCRACGAARAAHREGRAARGVMGGAARAAVGVRSCGLVELGFDGARALGSSEANPRQRN